MPNIRICFLRPPFFFFSGLPFGWFVATPPWVFHQFSPRRWNPKAAFRRQTPWASSRSSEAEASELPRPASTLRSAPAAKRRSLCCILQRDVRTLFLLPTKKTGFYNFTFCLDVSFSINTLKVELLAGEQNATEEWQRALQLFWDMRLALRPDLILQLLKGNVVSMFDSSIPDWMIPSICWFLKTSV